MLLSSSSGNSVANTSKAEGFGNAIATLSSVVAGAGAGAGAGPDGPGAGAEGPDGIGGLGTGGKSPFIWTVVANSIQQ